jgi:hypothetical protein
VGHLSQFVAETIMSITKPGKALVGHFESIKNYTIELTYDWQTYRTLFGHSEQRFKLLQLYTTQFFRVVHDSLLETIILGISRLQDPARIGKFENHSCAFFIRICEEDGQLPLAAALKDILAETQEASEAISDYRNKRVAHRDLTLATASTLSPGSRANFAKVIGLHQKFIQTASDVIEPGVELGWDIISHGDAETIVSVLKGYRAFERFERDNWQTAREYENHEFKDA